MCSLLAATQRGRMLSAAWSPPSGPPSSQRGFKGLIYTPGLIGKVRGQKQANKQTNQTRLYMLLRRSLTAKKSDQVTGGWRPCILTLRFDPEGRWQLQSLPVTGSSKKQSPGPQTSCGQSASRKLLSCVFTSLFINPCHRFLPWRAQPQLLQRPPAELDCLEVLGFVSCSVLCSWRFFLHIFPV